MTICMIAHTFSLAYGRSRVVSQNDNGAKKKKKKGSWVMNTACV